MQFIQSGQGLDVAIPPGQSIAISSITGTYSATLLDGAGRGALASGSSRGATYGPYPSGATVRVTAGNIDLMKWSQYVDSMNRGKKVVGVS